MIYCLIVSVQLGKSRAFVDSELTSLWLQSDGSFKTIQGRIEVAHVSHSCATIAPYPGAIGIQFKGFVIIIDGLLIPS
jgi:hypothetical protein